ncbi:HCL298Wp [Eremothecium sinecaudum]|uniref:HCL298Wp n=1 Tax=Eremothecium sinecaudum TaxID=45286 RepID=A0A109UYM6_9SACH|nr:HCL298Wp [Eremothecium sinecaudum]AMD19853.1 HCL298Wp [Eremothecium sinecaudum]
MFLQLLALCGTILGFLFLTLSIASGLYYLSELIEEYSEPTRRFLTKAIYVIVGLHVLLLFDGFPILLTFFSIASYFIHYQNLKQFPFVSLSSPTFICTCILVALNHYFWLRHFNDVEIPPQYLSDPMYMPRKKASFTEVTSFFAICIWFIPFSLFVSLSAGENILPTTMGKKNDDYDSSNMMRRKASSLVKVIIDSVREYFSKIASVVGIRSHRTQDHLTL